MHEEERIRRGINTLPASLLEAIKLTEQSELVRKALGDHVFDAFIKNKVIEKYIGQLQEEIILNSG